jgi:FkbM family methyltransferase
VILNFKQRLKRGVSGSSVELPLRWLAAALSGRKNAVYDFQTLRLMRRVLTPQSNCIDVGCHQGDILASMLRLAPLGQHYAFEPLPQFHKALVERFARRPGVHLHSCALGRENGAASFQHVTSNPAYSGLLRRRYDRPDERIETIQVQVRQLDEVLVPAQRIDFIKIDIEGGELDMLRGAERTLAQWQPVLVFEHGLGAADYYGSTPAALRNLLADVAGLQVYLLDQASRRSPQALSEAEFVDHFESGRHYYFMAARPNWEQR